MYLKEVRYNQDMTESSYSHVRIYLRRTSTSLRTYLKQRKTSEEIEPKPDFTYFFMARENLTAIELETVHLDRYFGNYASEGIGVFSDYMSGIMFKIFIGDKNNLSEIENHRDNINELLNVIPFKMPKSKRKLKEILLKVKEIYEKYNKMPLK